jgi:hypothetical protein
MKYFPTVSLAFIALIIPVSVTLASTNCDNQAKPALGCPTGYSMMCNPVGGDHWSCGKEGSGAISNPSNPSGTAVPGVVQYRETNLEFIKKESSSSESETKGDDNGTGMYNSMDNGTNTEELDMGMMGQEIEKYIKFAGVKGEKNNENLNFSLDNLDNLRADIEDGKVSVRGWDPKEKKLTVGPESINTAKDLAEYAAGLAAQDENIEGIETGQNEMSFHYSNEGKLFGIFPIKFSALSTIDTGSSTERVKVKFPWYSFFIKKDFSETDLEQAIQGGLGEGEIRATSSLQGNITRLAQMMSTISNVLKTKHDTVKNSINNIR